MASRSAFFTLVLSVLAFVPAGAARADVANGASGSCRVGA